MNWRAEGDKYILILETGDEIVATLQKFAKENNIRGGFFFGLGAAENCIIGYYDVVAGQYSKRTILAQREITSLVGDISLIEGEFFTHCHIQLSDAEMNVKGGHLFEGHVSPTCEIMLFPSEKSLERKVVPGKEFKMIKL